MNHVIAFSSAHQLPAEQVQRIQYMAKEVFEHDLTLNPFASNSVEHRIYADAMLDLQTKFNTQEVTL